MKVLFISDNFPPEVNAPSIRTFEHCKKWSSLGDDVTVITCFPNFPKGVIFNGYINKFSENSKIENINVTRVWSYIAKNEGFIKRVFDYISFSITSFISAMFKDFEIVVSTSPQFFTSFTGYFIKIVKKKKWVFEVRDLWPDTIAAVGAIKRDSILYRILEKIELALYKRADLVVVVTKSFKENLIKRGIDENKIKIVYNGIDKSFVEKNLIKTRIQVRNELNLNNKKIIGYIGTIGMTHDLISIVKECRKLPDEYHLLIVGEGAAKNQLLDFINENKINNVSILDQIPKNMVASYINAIDISLIHLKKCDTFKNVIPSKIFENAAMKKKILLGVEGEAKSIVEDYKLGLAFEPSNFNSFTDVLKKCDDFEVNDNSEFILKFSRDTQAKNMREILKKL